jgi:hypothetical protein
VTCQQFDEQVVRLDAEIATIARDFVLARVTDMRGVDLATVRFDYDLTWAAFVLDADGHVYARYGSREGDSAEDHLSLAGLKHTLRKALAAYRRGEKPPADRPEPAKTVEQYPAAKRLRDTACIHCHQVNDFRIDERVAAGTWTKADVWAYVYPPPRTVGLTMDVNQGDRIKAVAADSAAARAGLRARDVIQRLDGRPVASIADLMYGLHLAPAAGSVAIVFERDGAERTATLTLPDGWKKSDISWRPSVWSLPPAPGVRGQDLSAAEKAALGLTADRLAFRQGTAVSAAGARAGLRAGDVIVGVHGKRLAMTARQFNAHVRVTYAVGDTVTYDVLRDGKAVKVTITLTGREE